MISSGPFKGMNGPITDLRVRYNVMAPTGIFSGNVVEPLEVRLSVGYVSMFQFMAFYDVAQAKISTGPPMDMNGRLRSNGDICVGGSGGYESFLKITVGGRLIEQRRWPLWRWWHTSRISTNTTFTAFADLTAAGDNGCTNCPQYRSQLGCVRYCSMARAGTGHGARSSAFKNCRSW